MEVKPIGSFQCDAVKNYDVPRQAFLNNNNIGFIQLNSHLNFEQALQDLEGFSHIWLIYLFDNQTWKPKVQTPRSLQKKGVFATRSPYRPNPLGMSLVKLKSIDHLKIYIENFDLLNNTQIIDLKPYIKEADSVINSQQGWLKGLKSYKINFSDKFYKNLILNIDESPNKIINFINNQLQYCPIDHPNKRVKQDKSNFDYLLSYKYLRILFSIQESTIFIKNIYDSKKI